MYPTLNYVLMSHSEAHTDADSSIDLLQLSSDLNRPLLDDKFLFCGETTGPLSQYVP